jgi:hypothetical protein
MVRTGTVAGPRSSHLVGEASKGLKTLLSVPFGR